VVLSTELCTTAQAKDWEHAYRQAAEWHGWRVYAEEPCVVIKRVGTQMNGRRWMAFKVWWRFGRLVRD
jgi:hypothetical protein